MRLIAQGKDPLEGQKHMCGMGNLFHYHSTGFPELDELMKTPQPLIFIMELVQVKDGKKENVPPRSDRRGASVEPSVSSAHVLYYKPTERVGRSKVTSPSAQNAVPSISPETQQGLH